MLKYRPCEFTPYLGLRGIKFRLKFDRYIFVLLKNYIAIVGVNRVNIKVPASTSNKTLWEYSLCSIIIKKTNNFKYNHWLFTLGRNTNTYHPTSFDIKFVNINSYNILSCTIFISNSFNSTNIFIEIHFPRINYNFCIMVISILTIFSL